MERLQLENYYDSHDQTHYGYDDEVARIIDRRQTVFSRLYKRGLAKLGNLMVSWGMRLQQRDGKLITANSKGNPSPC